MIQTFYPYKNKDIVAEKYLGDLSWKVYERDYMDSDIWNYLGSAQNKSDVYAVCRP